MKRLILRWLSLAFWFAAGCALAGCLFLFWRTANWPGLVAVVAAGVVLLACPKPGDYQ